MTSRSSLDFGISSCVPAFRVCGRSCLSSIKYSTWLRVAKRYRSRSRLLGVDTLYYLIQMNFGSKHVYSYNHSEAEAYLSGDFARGLGAR